MSEPVCRIRIGFEGQEKPWEYPIALNGRIVASVSLNGDEYAPKDARDSLIRSMLLTLVLAAAGNISPMELNKKIEEYAEIMEQLGALEG